MTALSISETTLLPSSFASAHEAALSIVDYFSQPEEYVEKQQLIDRDGNIEEREVVRYRPVPMLEEWCMRHRITVSQLKKAAQLYPEVAEAIEFARDVIKVNIVRGALVERYNASIAKFTLTNETDMVDRTEQINKNLNANASDVLDEIEKASKPIRR